MGLHCNYSLSALNRPVRPWLPLARRCKVLAAGNNYPSLVLQAYARLGPVR